LTKSQRHKKDTKTTRSDSKRIVIDVDGTVCHTKDEGVSYLNARPNLEVIRQIQKYKDGGFTIVLYTSRQMRTHESNLGKIVANTVPVLIEWLKRNKVPFDEIHIGKPWCGFEGFYVDDKSVRPNEFASMSYKEITKLLDIGKKKE